MSSKEKVLAIRPEATLSNWGSVSGHCYYSIYDGDPRVLNSEALALYHRSEPEAWAAAYKYLTK